MKEMSALPVVPGCRALVERHLAFACRIKSKGQIWSLRNVRMHYIRGVLPSVVLPRDNRKKARKREGESKIANRKAR